MAMNFGTELTRYRLRAGLAGSVVARSAGISAGYLSRIERAEREPPRRSIVVAMADCLHLNDQERDDLLRLAGFAPALIEDLAQLAANDPDVRRILVALVERPALAGMLLAVVET